MDLSVLGRQWRQDVLSPWRWHRAPNQAGAVSGVSDGFVVYCAEALATRAYMKPARKVTDVCMLTAAREKIASDLAHDLGVRVPPAILTVRPDVDPASDDEPNTVVTAVMTPEQQSWGFADPTKGYLQPKDDRSVRAAVPQASARALVFDTWIDQLDHGDQRPDDRHNIIVGRPAGGDQKVLIFLDYSFSLGIKGDWRNLGYQTVAEVPFPSYMLKHLDRDELSCMMTEVEAYPDTAIDAIVQRIPDSHLPPSERDLIAEGLCARRSLIRPALERRLNGA